MIDTKKILANDQLFTGLDRQFAGFMARLAQNEAPELLLAAALVSMRTRDGHSCLDLAGLAGRPLRNMGHPIELGPSADHMFPELQPWVTGLRESRVVGMPGDRTPLVLDHRARLYLHRYWEYEKTVADFIKSRTEFSQKSVNLPLLSEKLNSIFPSARLGETNWQKIAAIIAALGQLCIISGGPGTGKTTTVTKILSLLIELAEPGKKMRILLTAPTGKAAARLQETLNRIQTDKTSSVVFPKQVTTLHRLLGSIPGSPYFRHNQHNPLPAEVVVVDEASMVDLPLMAKLMQAIPADARLILLGDRDQLASVEPGSVMGDICRPENIRFFSQEFKTRLAEISGETINCEPSDPDSKESSGGNLRNAMVELRKNYRFKDNSGIMLLSMAVRQGDSTTALAVLKDKTRPDINWSEIPSPAELDRKLGDRLSRLGDNFLVTDSPEQAFASLNRFRILCGLRHGPYGVHVVNNILERLLRQGTANEPEQKKYPADQTGRYHGLPIMITRNSYHLDLYNGDVGIMLRDRQTTDADGLRVYFQTRDSDIRSVSPARLPPHETVYAMTVHKSQGSEFDNILLILPDRESPVLTRELLYTAVTRARKSIEIWASRAVLQKTVAAVVKRDSGLAEALWG